MNAKRSAPTRVIAVLGLGLTFIMVASSVRAQGAPADSSAPAPRDTLAAPPVPPPAPRDTLVAPPVPPPAPAGSDSIVISPPASSTPGTPLPAAPTPAAPTPAAAPRGLADPAACVSGEKDAKESRSFMGYTAAGALTGPIAVGFAWFKSPSPPASKSIDTSTDAGREYARCYGKTARHQNIRGAIQGMAATTMLVLIGVWYADSATAP